MLRAFGFEDFDASLSTRPAKAETVGTDEGWAEATENLRAALEAEGLPFDVDEGGGAFYGPKIDVKVRDAIGRSWQLSTIQYDFNMASRMGLEYIGEDGARHTPVMAQYLRLKAESQVALRGLLQRPGRRPAGDGIVAAKRVLRFLGALEEPQHPLVPVLGVEAECEG